MMHMAKLKVFSIYVVWFGKKSAAHITRYAWLFDVLEI
jgi:hypothetical protein